MSEIGIPVALPVFPQKRSMLTSGESMNGDTTDCSAGRIEALVLCDGMKVSARTRPRPSSTHGILDLEADQRIKCRLGSQVEVKGALGGTAAVV